jgi:hypothetical protein
MFVSHQVVSFRLNNSRSYMDSSMYRHRHWYWLSLARFLFDYFHHCYISVFGKFEYLIDRLNNSKTISLTFNDADIDNIYSFEKMLKERKIKSKRIMMNKLGGKLFAF